MNKMNINAKNGMEEQDRQYSLLKIFTIWFLVTAPMTFFAFYVAPNSIKWFNIPANTPPMLVFWPWMILGMVWQFVLSLIIVYREEGNIKLSTISRRMCYTRPRDPRTGKENNWLLLWVLPFIALTFLLMFFVHIPDVAGKLFPFINNLPEYNLMQVMGPQFAGAWWLLGLVMVTLPFNYLLGEEFIFRGILLPKMKGVFGKWDWFFNGVFFAFYHLHKPHGILNQILFSGLLLSFPSKRWRSNWMAVLIHGIEGLIAFLIVLKIVLG